MRSRRSTPGPKRCIDLEAALAGILDCFRIGRSTLLTSLFRPRIDRILFAATKADHLHHSSHDRLEAVLRRTVAKAVARAEDTGAAIDVVALAAVRATREAQVARGRDKLPSILGTPAPGEIAGGEALRRQHRGRDLSGRPARRSRSSCSTAKARFAGFPAPAPKRPISAFFAFGRRSSKAPMREGPTLPHIRLDRALQFLIGDRLQ